MRALLRCRCSCQVFADIFRNHLSLSYIFGQVFGEIFRDHLGLSYDPPPQNTHKIPGTAVCEIVVLTLTYRYLVPVHTM